MVSIPYLRDIPLVVLKGENYSPYDVLHQRLKIMVIVCVNVDVFVNIHTMFVFELSSRLVL